MVYWIQFSIKESLGILATRIPKQRHPSQILLMGFISLILIGTVLLSMPAASVNRHSIGLIDALFTSTSAVCVTGLVVLDTGTQFTLFGQIVILILIQCGGLGFMSTASLIFFIIGKRITLRERIIIKEAMNELSISTVVDLVKSVLVFTFIIEFLGAVLLSFRFIPQFGVAGGIYRSVFHSVSAFCNAGFDLMGGFNSFSNYVADPLVNLTFIGLIIIGGLGFVVVFDLFQKLRSFGKTRLALHTKLVLIASGILIALGLIVYFGLELNNPDTLKNLSPKGKILAGIFQSVTPRTAGFSTIDEGKLTTGSKLMTMILMFIGASPAGTGGGIKTTTMVMVTLLIASVAQGRNSITVMKRRIKNDITLRAVTLFIGGLTLVVVSTMLIMAIESGKGGLFSFENILFEAFSAFGTVGLGTGITPFLEPLSRIVIILSMFAGRVGLLTVMYAMANRMNKYEDRLRYTEENIMIG